MSKKELKKNIVVKFCPTFSCAGRLLPWRKEPASRKAGPAVQVVETKHPRLKKVAPGEFVKDDNCASSITLIWRKKDFLFGHFGLKTLAWKTRAREKQRHEICAPLQNRSRLFSEAVDLEENALKGLATAQNMFWYVDGNENTIIYSDRIEQAVHNLSINYIFKLAKNVQKQTKNGKCRELVVKPLYFGSAVNDITARKSAVIEHHMLTV